MVPAADARARSRLRRRVLDWYAATGRPLPFRATNDPWAILISEVMAQQTQAARAAVAWQQFMAAYPRPAALAAAPTAEVIRAWRGLGYNRRAVSLQRAAQAIVREHEGAVPPDLQALLRLPGVGPYTARAVAALAFGQRVGAVDTNVRRVLARAFLGEDPRVDDRSASRTVQALADALAPRATPGAWTHALMDVGATVCRVRSPRCGECPLAVTCLWKAGHYGAVASVAPSLRPRVARRCFRASPPVASRGFASTSRWLRGRILDRLRDLDDGAWLVFDEAIGTHGAATVAHALVALQRDGLLELRSTTPPEARLPHP